MCSFKIDDKIYSRIPGITKHPTLVRIINIHDGNTPEKTYMTVSALQPMIHESRIIYPDESYNQWSVGIKDIICYDTKEDIANHIEEFL